MASAPQAPKGPDYEESFLRILNNKSKQATSTDEPFRRQGFVVLVRDGNSLKPLQDLCLNPERQTHNHCYTARYRLQPKMAIGTLLIAWASDLAKMHGGQKDLRGDLQPGPFGKTEPNATGGSSEKISSVANERWRNVAAVFREGPIGDPAKSGEITDATVKDFLAPLATESVLQIGDRLVLFAELGEEATDLVEWTTAFEMFFTRLPERMGIVVSGAPKDFTLPRDDPHFLEITVPRDYGGGTAQVAYKYIDSSFHSDQPATKDELDVNRYADAIARFILHPHTSPPLTIGIQWDPLESTCRHASLSIL